MEERKLYFSVKEATEKMLSFIKDGHVGFLPDQGGNWDTVGIRNAETGKLYYGANQLLAKGYMSELGMKSNVILTHAQAERFQTQLKRNPNPDKKQSFVLSLYDAVNKESKHYRYFPLESVLHPEKIKTPTLKNEKNHEMSEIKCFDSEPVKYLSKYLQAVSLNCKFNASKDITEEFKKKLVTDIENGIKENKYTRIFEISNEASKLCRAELTQMFQKNRVVQEIEKEQITQKRKKKPSPELSISR